MKKPFSLTPFIFLLAFAVQINAQNGFNDNFNDSNFTSNPIWIGDVAKFRVTANKELQLNDAGASSTNETYLSTFSSAINNATWEFYVRLDFNPSTSNFGKVYLVSDNSDLTTPLNGYYVKVGGQSGTVDNVRLYRQDGSSDTLLIDGIAGTVANSPAVKIRVAKSSTNEWSLFLDATGIGNAYQLQGLSTDNKYNSSSYFGVFCDYTSTRFDKFFFDDFMVTEAPLQDTVGPVLTQVTILSNQKLELVFNEKLDSTSAVALSNFAIDKSIGSPSFASFTSIDSATIELDFATPFTNGDEYELTVQNVADKAGNLMQASTWPFIYFVPVPAAFRDIVINELYPDPSPSNGLPEAEYIELFNASNKVFDLNGWAFADGSSSTTLGNQIIRPGDYLILCPSASITEFSSYGMVQGQSNFPSLNNAGDNLTLTDNTGNTIDFVNYDDDWYQDNVKKDGGYSLEQINPFTNCTGQANFSASDKSIGGTPGVLNSIFDTMPDIAKPNLTDVLILSDSTLLIRFDEVMDSASLLGGTYAFSPVVQVRSVEPFAPHYTEVFIALDSKLDSGIFYSITVSNVNDCSGNPISSSNQKTIALPSNALPNDVIINEILFNPRSGSVDFVELYNRSEKVITLEKWQLANFDDTVSNYKIITETPVLLFPKEYIVFTEDKTDIIQQYPLTVANNVLEIVDVPSYNDDEGRVYLFNSNLQLIDEVQYEDDYHFALLADDDGVSLERINSEKLSLDESNWHSASEKVGFATPGYKNSQDFTNPNNSGTIELDPGIISPDNDGFQDVLSINYNFESPGYVANVSILDRNGRLIKKLVNNELLGREGNFFWDGITDSNAKARVGIYIVLFEAFNLAGDKEVFKEVFTVASQLKKY